MKSANRGQTCTGLGLSQSFVCITINKSIGGIL